ncbi:MAG: hypothetical protein HQL72_11705 [Magnetococcales bacterium]|nr:hypothetical protein [Magnetococcales bacterium]
MIINTYNTFAHNVLNSRQPAQKYSTTSSNPLLHSTPEALTFQLIDALDSNSSGGLGHFESGLNNGHFSQVDQTSEEEVGFKDLTDRIANERNSYVELLFIHSPFSAFKALSEEGFAQMISADSEGNTLMETAFKTQDRSNFQKFSALNQNLLYHTLLNPAQPQLPPTETESGETAEIPQESAPDLFEIIATLKEQEILALTP